MTLVNKALIPVSELVENMLFKLKVHEAKNHWAEEDLWWLFLRVGNERDELAQALGEWSLSPTTANWREVEYEAADIANFLMMIIDIGRTKHHPELRQQWRDTFAPSRAEREYELRAD